MNQTWKIIIAIVVTAIVVGGYFYIVQVRPNKPEELNSGWRLIIKNNCEQSGGTFTNDKCNCPAGYKPDMYDRTSGYCATDEGMPGGKVGQDMIDKYNYKVELEQCKKGK